MPGSAACSAACVDADGAFPYASVSSTRNYNRGVGETPTIYRRLEMGLEHMEPVLPLLLSLLPMTMPMMFPFQFPLSLLPLKPLPPPMILNQ